MTLVFAATFLLGAIFGVAEVLFEEEETISDSDAGLIGLAYILAFGTFIVYYIVPIAFWGTTLGKKAFGIYLLNSRGERRIGIGRATLRLFTSWVSGIFYIGYILAAYREDGRTLHDLIAGTYATKP